MKKEELLYTFSRDEYLDAKARKDSIRGKSSLLVGIGVPVLTSLFALLLKGEIRFSSAEIIMFSLSAAFAALFLLFFIRIIAPSDQFVYTTEKIAEDVSSLNDKSENKEYIKELSRQGKSPKRGEEAADGIAFDYFVSIYQTNSNLYNKTIEHIKVLFFHLVFFYFASFIALIIAFFISSAC